MKPDKTPTQSASPHPATGTFDPALDAGLAAAFGPDTTPGGWSQPPLLRDDPSENSPLVQPSSTEMPRGTPERYQLLGEIARGGMGVILKGRDPDLGRDLAFKVLKAELADRPTAVQRFVEEAQVGGQLQHPGVVPVYDLGRFADGRPYFAMKLVKGRTLAELLAERENSGADTAGSPSDRGKFLQIFLQICQPVAYAHSKGVIHRDIKPSNIMVGAFGEVLVMDWGLAKVLPRGGVADEIKASRLASAGRQPPVAEEPTVIHTARSGSGAGSDTQAGSVMGTPAFMPPEQAGGEIDKLDERADVFGLGAVLCVILTGQPPYVADTAEATRLMAIRGDLEDAFARLDVCGTDTELVALCKRCLSAKRDARPRHAGEVAEAVSAYLAGVEQRAHQAEVDRAAAEARTAEEVNTRREAEAKTIEERKRRRMQLALAASIGLLLLGGGAFGWWQDRQASERAAERERAENEMQAAAVRRQNEDTLRTAAEVAEQQRRQTVTERDATAALESLRSLIADARKLEDDPERMKLTLVGARSHLGRAEAVLAAGNPTEDVRQRVADGARELAQADRDARLLAAIEALFIGIGKSNRFDGVLSKKFETAFRESGLDIFGSPAETVAERLKSHPHRRRLQLGIFYWFINAVNDAAAKPEEDLKAEQELKRLGDAIGALQDDPTSPFQLTIEAFGESEAKHNAAALIALSRDPKTVNWSPLDIFYLALTLGNFDRQAALELWTAAVERHPGSFLLNYCLGKCLHELGGRERLQQSVRYLTAAVALRPNSADALYELAHALNRLLDVAAAIRYLERAVAAAPDHFQARFDLGLGYRLQKRYPEAIAALREVIRMVPDFPDAHLELGIALREVGRTNEAIVELEKAAKLNMLLFKPHQHLAWIYWHGGDPARAEAEWTKAILLAPKNAGLLAEYGGWLSWAGQVEEAIKQLRKAIALAPKDPHPMEQLAWLLATHHEGRWRDGQEAVKLATRACELTNWKDPGLLDTLAAAYAEAGDFDKAVEYQRKALSFPEFVKQFGPVVQQRLELYSQKKPFREVPPAPVAAPPREKKW